MAVLRIGVVNYLNALPLWDALRGQPGIELVPDVPSALAAKLAAGHIDAGLLPVIEYFRQPSTRIVPGACIGTHGAVKSVRLFHRVALSEVRSLALDPGSRTSNVLAQIILRDLYRVNPAIDETPWQKLDDVKADAAVMIGDPALRALETSKLASIDLGESWHELTGLPFVFAAWLATPSVDMKALQETLSHAAQAGIEHIDIIASQHASKHGLQPDDVARYLRENVRYDFGPDQIAGLKEYGQRAATYKLAPARGVTFPM